MPAPWEYTYVYSNILLVASTRQFTTLVITILFGGSQHFRGSHPHFREQVTEAQRA